jgi:branched-chain amino acid transport system substrate-binding protein
MRLLHKTLAAAAALLATTAFGRHQHRRHAVADRPGSGLGIPGGQPVQAVPQGDRGEKVNLIILDDASDPGKGVTNARRFVTDDKVDLIIGGSITVVSAPSRRWRRSEDAAAVDRAGGRAAGQEPGSSACRRASR